MTEDETLKAKQQEPEQLELFTDPADIDDSAERAFYAKAEFIEQQRFVDFPDISRVYLPDFTELCGSSIMAKYPKDVIFITKMKIQQTTVSKILNSCNAQAIYHYIHKNVSKMKVSLKKCAKIWQRLVNVQKLGIIQKKGLNGILNTQKNNAKGESQENSCAIAAERNLKLRISE